MDLNILSFLNIRVYSQERFGFGCRLTPPFTAVVCVISFKLRHNRAVKSIINPPFFRPMRVLFIVPVLSVKYRPYRDLDRNSVVVHSNKTHPIHLFRRIFKNKNVPCFQKVIAPFAFQFISQLFLLVRYDVFRVFREETIYGACSMTLLGIGKVLMSNLEAEGATTKEEGWHSSRSMILRSFNLKCFFAIIWLGLTGRL